MHIFMQTLRGQRRVLVVAFLGLEAAELATPAGFLRAELSSWIPAVVIVFAVLAGSRALAAEEEAGQLDLLLAAPVTRTTVLVQKLAALATSVVIVIAGLWVGVQGTAWMVSMDVPMTSVAAEMVQLAALGFAFGAAALLIAAVTGRRGLSAGVAGAIAAASYLLHSLSGIVDVLEPWRRASLYYYYAASAPITNGLNEAHLAVLLMVGALLGVAAVWAFNHRDISI